MSEEQETQFVSNKDNESLGFYDVGKGIVIVHVWEVNGEGGREFPEFVATRNELLNLVKYWACVSVHCDYRCFLYGMSGTWESRASPFACRRVARIAGILGEDEVNKAVSQAIDQYGKQQDKRLWDTFRDGTDEQRSALQHEIIKDLVITSDIAWAKGEENPDSGTEPI